MGPGGVRRLCSPLAIGLVEWRIAWISRLLQPNDGQALLLRQLADVSLQAKQAIAAGCADSGQLTTATQLDRMERRLEGLAEAVALMQPSYDQFYAALNERQKAQLEALGPARRGWRW
ncbi:Spy/CpxP family protein refolding chaperone [Tardiphaga sp.]|uniref:Spy/CpxP family protein refolding chaperone n=1 Tax=Tardiphaga sp. TaxID=1926292 RepID=UPI00352B12CD|nr:Spy/CpxP family protein refolding chaperone [Hyphomicrobiales bacterium]